MEKIEYELDSLLRNYSELDKCRSDIINAYNIMLKAYQNREIIMTCGNGGSASDSGHIVGELMKGFKQYRHLTSEQRQKLVEMYPEHGDYLANNMQQAIPAIALTDQMPLITAFCNDVAPDMVYAQQVQGYSSLGGVLIGLSTSGNSSNIVNACKVAKAFGIKTIGFTGENGGQMRTICDVTICVPASQTFRIQEYHLPIYHTLCSMLEKTLF